MYWMCQKRNPPRRGGRNESHFFLPRMAAVIIVEGAPLSSPLLKEKGWEEEGMQGGQVEGWKEEGSKHFPPSYCCMVARQTKADTECSFFPQHSFSPFPFPPSLLALATSNHFRLLRLLLLPGKSFYYTFYPPLPHYTPLPPNWRQGGKTNWAHRSELTFTTNFRDKSKKILFLSPSFLLESIR